MYLFSQGLADRNREKLKTALENIVGGSVLDVFNCGLISQGPRDHDERNFLFGLMKHFERIEPRPRAQVVGTDEKIVIGPL